MTMVEKIIAAHAIADAKTGALGIPAVQPGDALFVRTDVRFSHEYVTPMADALFSAALLALMTARYFVPTEVTLDEAGVRVRALGRERRRPWAEVRALYPHRDGVHLSPFARPSALDPFRGIYLRFAGNRDAVLGFCERHVRPAP